MDDGATRHFSADECIALLGDSGVARVALSRHALPVIDPVHYRLAGDLLVIAGERGGPIATSADEHHVVCFEAEGPSSGDGARWVVQVTGLLGTVGEHQVLRLTATMISGRVWLTPDRTPW
jgi:nitroimidazol reductase NimA-like FMN-containing flavoprotein (pyridoxamine 5'-phosphate oxidase superfamily)